MKILWLLLTTSAFAQQLWYTQPARKWEEALPVGNGRIGAMVHGGVAREWLQLNEKSVWSGHPYYIEKPEMRESIPKARELLFAGRYGEAEALVQRTMTTQPDPRYGSYKPLGDLRLTFDLPTGETENYRRELDLDAAVARTTFTLAGTTYTRTVFTSAPAQALVMRIESNRRGAVSLKAALGREREAATRAQAAGRLVMEGQCDNGGVRFHALVEARVEGGKLSASAAELVVMKADAVTLLLVANTNYRLADPAAESRRQLRVAPAYGKLLADHLADYRRYFRRVQFDLTGPSAAGVPTDERIRRAASVADPGLAVLYFHFGRYLLISSSRPGELPANLQGLWNPLFNPPWFSDYTININVQMNYWLAEPANLAELHEPLFDLIERLREPARRTARERFGAGGLALSTRTNIWGATDLRGSSGLLWYDSPAWLALHLWEAYRYSLDRRFLDARVWPVLKEAAQFYLEFLVEDPRSKRLVVGPSTSPENRFLTKDGEKCSVVMGPAMTMQIVRELFAACVQASTLLGKDAAMRGEIDSKLARLAPIATGSRGQILEWPEESVEAEPTHRHVSHLFALHPGTQITPRATPELAAAARKTLELRGDGGTGWGTAWKVNFWARLGDGERAHALLVRLLSASTLPNLFDTHPPFQIDGNFGGAAGIVEVLLQSHAGDVHLLPALPPQWTDGRIAGLRARGGVGVDLEWSAGQLTRATVRAPAGSRCIVRYGAKTIAVASGTHTLTAADFGSSR
jgi:alpha-L-fucosidase 2